MDGYVLDAGGHSRPEQGVCLMEAVAWVAGESHSASPATVSPELIAFGQVVNDGMPHEQRQRLAQFVPRFIGTRNDGQQSERLRMIECCLSRIHGAEISYRSVFGTVEARHELHDRAAACAKELVRLAAWDAIVDVLNKILPAAPDLLELKPAPKRRVETEQSPPQQIVWMKPPSSTYSVNVAELVGYSVASSE